jgi:hypothetical protein
MSEALSLRLQKAEGRAQELEADLQEARNSALEETVAMVLEAMVQVR